MAKFTTQLKSIIENINGNVPSSYANANQFIAVAAPIILGPYPIFDENYRPVLSHNILAYYYTREIGFETVGLFKFRIQNELLKIMPYFNQLYLSTRITYDPLQPYDLTRQHETKNTGNQTSAQKTDTVSQDDKQQHSANSNAFSDTPHGPLSNVEENEYLTDYRYIKDDSTESLNATANSTTDSNTDIWNLENYIEKVTGVTDKWILSDLILKYRDTFINIDMQIIEALEPMFMMIF